MKPAKSKITVLGSHVRIHAINSAGTESVAQLHDSRNTKRNQISIKAGPSSMLNNDVKQSGYSRLQQLF